MAGNGLLWPARLHHLRRDSGDPQRLARFYGKLLGDRVERLAKDEWLVRGRDRILIAGRGAPGSVPFFALALRDAKHLASYGKQLDRLGVKRETSPSPLFAAGAFAVADPDGRRVVFGLPTKTSRDSGLPGRLQHFVCASAAPDALLAFYRDTLGMR